MKIPRIANAVGYIDDDLVSDAIESEKKKKNPWVRWGALAACFAVLVIASVAVFPSLLGGDAVDPEGTDGRYKDFNAVSPGMAPVWPREYVSVYEKFGKVEINGVKYCIISSRGVSNELIGDKIGTYTFAGYDETMDFEVYQLKNVKQNQFIAVEMEGIYCVFINDEYNPPSTLGEFLQDANLPTVVELKRFSEDGDGPDRKHFTLNNDDYVWEVLSECHNAAFIEDEDWTPIGKDALYFTITSESIGVYKNSMCITADGYLWTNMFRWGHLFDIGEDAASKIIKYAKENSAEAEYEPYNNSIFGKVTEITEDYILVDDSILCKDPADGIIYRVMLNDIRISRYIDYGIIEMGETVWIQYEGEIDEKNFNTISNVSSISETSISYKGEIEEPDYNAVSSCIENSEAVTFDGDVSDPGRSE